jgi:hypothetical protein
MSAKAIFFLGFVMLFSSCNNEGKSSSEIKSDFTLNEPATEAITDSVVSGCYAQIAGRDTANIQIESKGSNITGTLSYAIFEKDRNDGTLQAEISGGLLTGWYLFKSEGIISVRQVSWKVKGNELWPGTGEMYERNDTMFFSLPDKLQYDSSRAFKKVDCIL